MLPVANSFDLRISVERCTSVCKQPTRLTIGAVQGGGVTQPCPWQFDTCSGSGGVIRLGETPVSLMFVSGEWAGRPTWIGCYNIAFDLGVGGLNSAIESPIGWGPWGDCRTTAGHSQIHPLLLAHGWRRRSHSHGYSFTCGAR